MYRKLSLTVSLGASLLATHAHAGALDKTAAAAITRTLNQYYLAANIDEAEKRLGTAAATGIGNEVALVHMPLGDEEHRRVGNAQPGRSERHLIRRLLGRGDEGFGAAGGEHPADVNVSAALDRIADKWSKLGEGLGDSVVVVLERLASLSFRSLW